MKAELVRRDFHDLETHLNRAMDFAGIHSKISVVISSGNGNASSLSVACILQLQASSQNNSRTNISNHLSK